MPETISDFYQFGRTEFTFVVKDVDQLDSVGQNSQHYGTGDIDWHLNVCMNTTPKGKFLSTFLYCNPVDVASAWETFGQFRIVLENHEHPKQSIARQMDFSFESEEAENRGWNTFTKLEDVVAESSGFLDKDGAITFRVIVGVKEVKGFETAKYFNFLEKGEYSDGIIEVDGYKFHVNKMIVSVHSPVISVHFANTDVIEFKDVDRLEFNDFLQLLYAVPIRIGQSNVVMMLRMSARFDTHRLKVACEQYLSSSQKVILRLRNDEEVVVDKKLLKSCSMFFHNHFFGKQRDTEFVVKVGFVSASNLHLLLKMYSDFENGKESIISEQKAVELLEPAAFLQIGVCIDYISDVICSGLSDENALKFYRLGLL